MPESPPTGPVPDDGPPPVVPGYRLQRLLGRGGSGEVWQAVPRAGGAPVAVKVLAAGDPQRQAREAALLGELDHPHLVRLLEVVHQPRRGDRSRVALVLELLPGGSLAALLARRGRLRPGEVVTAVAPVAAALAHAHDRGVVHGDLSPGNVVFTAEGRPVLTDLGVSRVLGEEAAAEVTPAYVDPTVARGGAPGPASDVFGVAAAAFHALTGVAPWNAASPAETLAVAASGTLPDLDALAPEAPAELRAVIARGLAADPHERGTAAAFALDLRHACRPEPVRLPVAGTADAELGRTGAGPRTELTHQVARRRSRADDVPAPRSRRRSVLAGRRGRRAGVLVGVLAVLGIAVWLGAPEAGPVGEPGGPRAAAAPAGTTALRAPQAAPPEGSPPVPATPPTEPAEDWAAVLGELYARRAAAFAGADPALLDGVYTAGSPLLAADREAVRALAAAGEVLAGFAPRVVAVSAAAVDGDRAELRVVDSWPDYAVVPATHPDGPPLRAGAGRGETAAVVRLLRTPGGWRIDTAARTG